MLLLYILGYTIVETYIRGVVFMVKVITFANFKGGTGKTTNSTALGYTLSKMGFKVALLDFDPQGNATTIYFKTADNFGNRPDFDKTVMSALIDGNLSSVIKPVKENLYLLPAYRDLKMYPEFLEDNFKSREDRVKYLSTLVEQIKDEFDFIFIDVPPTFSIYTNSALYCSDEVVLVAQAHEYSISGVEDFIEDAKDFIVEYDKMFNITGILPVILKPNSRIDKIAIKQAEERFGEENIFRVTINQMERLRRWAVTGITDDHKDINDRKVHERYEELAKELLERLEMDVVTNG